MKNLIYLEQKSRLGVAAITVWRVKLFPLRVFFSKCDQIRRKLPISSHLLKKSLMENFIFCAVHPTLYNQILNEFKELKALECLYLSFILEKTIVIHRTWEHERKKTRLLRKTDLLSIHGYFTVFKLIYKQVITDLSSSESDTSQLNRYLYVKCVVVYFQNYLPPFFNYNLDGNTQEERVKLLPPLNCYFIHGTSR